MLENPMALSDPEDSVDQSIDTLCRDGKSLIGIGDREYGIYGGHQASASDDGQIQVIDIEMTDPVKSTTLIARVSLIFLATISGTEKTREDLDEIVSTWDAPFSLEWTGEEWDCRFSHVLEFPVDLDEYESLESKDLNVAEDVRRRLLRWIQLNDTLGACRQSLKGLRQAMVVSSD